MLQEACHQQNRRERPFVLLLKMPETETVHIKIVSEESRFDFKQKIKSESRSQYGVTAYDS